MEPHNQLQLIIFERKEYLLSRSNISNYINEWDAFVKKGEVLEEVDRNRGRSSGQGRSKWKESNPELVKVLKEWGDNFRSKGKQLSVGILMEKIKKECNMRGIKFSKNEESLKKHAKLIAKQIGWKFQTSGHKD